MTVHSRVALLVFLLGSLSGRLGAQVDEREFIRILPLGDSITESSTGYASYRYYLWHELLGDGTPVDFVGTRNGVRDGEPLFSDFDADHDGHSGIRADELADQVEGWANQTKPQIVLLHLGTNDLWQGEDVPSTIDDLDAVIDGLRLSNPEITILLAQIIPSSPSKGFDVAPFNAEIPNLAAAKNTSTSPVIVVDQYTGFDPALDTYDGVHPNHDGEIKMAEVWLEALRKVLDTCPASWQNYGPGHPGTFGVPALTSSAAPLLGSTVTLSLGNSLGAMTSAVVLVGSSAEETPTLWGGSLQVGFPLLHFISIDVPAAGRSLPYGVADDPELCGTAIYLQALLNDPGASHGLAMTPGLELVFGY